MTVIRDLDLIACAKCGYAIGDHPQWHSEPLPDGGLRFEHDGYCPIPEDALHFDLTQNTYRVENDTIPWSTMGGPVPDERWRYRDAAGHHHWRSENGADCYPTLRWLGESGWCGLCRDHHDEDDHVFGEYRCRSCDEVIEPGTRWQEGESGYLIASTTFYVNDQPVSPDTWERLKREAGL